MTIVGDARVVEEKPKTMRSRRTVALPEIAVAALQRHLSRQAEERHTTGDECSQEFGDLVFRNRRGRPETSSTLTKRSGAAPHRQPRCARASPDVDADQVGAVRPNTLALSTPVWRRRSGPEGARQRPR